MKIIWLAIVFLFFASFTYAGADWRFFSQPHSGFISSTEHAVSYDANASTTWGIVWGLDKTYIIGSLRGSQSDITSDIRITGLTPDTQYFYFINVNGSEYNYTHHSNFTTMPSTNTEFKFAIMQDIHEGDKLANNNWTNNILKFLSTQSIKFIIQGSDMMECISSNGCIVNMKNTTDRFFNFTNDIPLYGIPGNHDPATAPDGGGRFWKDYFIHNENGEDGIGSWQVGAENQTVHTFNFSYGCFISSNYYLNNSAGNVTQFQWINQTLKGCNDTSKSLKLIMSGKVEPPHLQEYLDLADDYNAWLIEGDIQSTGYNLSQRTLRLSAAGGNPHTTYWNTDDWSDYKATGHFAIWTVNSTIALVDIYNTSPEINLIHTVTLNLTSPIAPTSPASPSSDNSTLESDIVGPSIESILDVFAWFPLLVVVVIGGLLIMAILVIKNGGEIEGIDLMLLGKLAIIFTGALIIGVVVLLTLREIIAVS